MKSFRGFVLVLLLLLPLCSAAKEFTIECQGFDSYMLNGPLTCTSKEQQACYTRDNGDKGCTELSYCSQPGWTCCYTDRCNA